MTISEYYDILGISANSTLEEIKKAYRKKAREFHPDLNHSADAEERFIMATEAYEFLIDNHRKIDIDEEAFKAAMEEWRKFRQYRSRMRAASFAQGSYNGFRNSKLYKSTKVPDLTLILFSLAISVIVLIYTVSGYIFRLKYPLPDFEKPSIIFFIMALIVGLVFLTTSIIYLKAYLELSRKFKKK